jgi:hypothetical protein
MDKTHPNSMVQQNLMQLPPMPIIVVYPIFPRLDLGIVDQVALPRMQVEPLQMGADGPELVVQPPAHEYPPSIGTEGDDVPEDLELGELLEEDDVMALERRCTQVRQEATERA